MNQNYTIAHLDDLQSILKIEDDCYPVGIKERPETFIERILTYPEGFLLTHNNGQCVGYICSEIWQLQDQPTADLFTLNHPIATTHNQNGNTLYISSMGILAKYRSNGLGQSLFKELINRINKPTKILIVG